MKSGVRYAFLYDQARCRHFRLRRQNAYLTPLFVRGLLVFPEFRGGAAFHALESAVETYAREAGFTYLHAGTTSIERMLARRGWEVFRRVSHGGEEMAWMRKPVSHFLSAS